jgi:hypothetical protein
MFDYVIKKIENAEFTETPFRHLYLENLFSPEHFDEITSAPEVHIPPKRDDTDLFNALFSNGYKIVNFPGCITNQKRYIAWHEGRKAGADTHSLCEGFGITLRLEEPRTDILLKIKAFLSSDAFNKAIAGKFDIPLAETFLDNGIQKYLDGYEISPHPDNRKKALTFMVNINPNSESEQREHHTHYLALKPEYQYVSSFWRDNSDCETCWIPWDWCETVSLQSKNNSIVIFSPSFDTIHGVRAHYDHLAGQRTQLYGNLWFSKDQELLRVDWEDLDIKSTAQHKKVELSLKDSIAGLLPKRSRRFVKRMLKRDTKTVVKVRLKK